MTVGEPERPRTFVLVPGAWLGAWSWHPVARRLRERGHRVLALTLPGLSYDDSADVGMTDAVGAIVDEVTRRDLQEVVLVAHSWGGLPASAAAHRLADRIALLVYYNAIVPARGLGLLDETPEGAAVRDALLKSGELTMPLTLEVVRELVVPDGTEELSAFVHALAVPQPVRYMLEGVDVGPVAEAGVASAYVMGDADTALPRPNRDYAARLGVTPLVIPGTHATMLHRPEDLARALLGLLDPAAASAADRFTTRRSR